jgi:hypothetical protein
LRNLSSSFLLGFFGILPGHKLSGPRPPQSAEPLETRFQ